MKNIKCPECGGKAEDQLIKMKYDINHNHITIKNIPAKVCQKCGNELIDGHTARDVDLLVNRLSEDVDRFAKSLAIAPEKEHSISLAV
ncbi:MAG: YgiT-type zinc finger protein [Candidatus Omnitrophica bacterium]|nr:YgiT-type zinc finger protein [Candidatus Omnitrophota bacterium]